MLLLRILLPDRPGSLGAVASAMGTAGADISAIEIVEKGVGYAIDHFMLTLPPGALPDNLVSACNLVPGVKVLWLSRHPEGWGLESDIEALEEMTADPAHAAEHLTQSAPTVFYCQWAALIDCASGSVITSTEMAPDLDADSLAQLAPFEGPRRFELPDGWIENWGQTAVAEMSISEGRCIVLGRLGGPDFLDSEMSRLQHLAGFTTLAH